MTWSEKSKEPLKNYPEEVVVKAVRKITAGQEAATDPQEVRNVARKLIRAEKARQTYIPKPPRPSRFARATLPEDFTTEQIIEFRKQEKKDILAREAREAYVPKVRSAEPYRKKEPVQKRTRQKEEKQTIAMLPEEGVTLEFS